LLRCTAGGQIDQRERAERRGAAGAPHVALDDRLGPLIQRLLDAALSFLDQPARLKQ